MQLKNKTLFILYLFFVISSCQTPGYYLIEQPQQIADIRKAINVVVGKTKKVSMNGREIFSHYHDDKFEPIQDDLVILDDPYYRYQTKVTILGPRRPYEINVQVIVEQYENETKKFLPVGVEDGLSRQRAIFLKKTLNLSPATNSRFDQEAPF